MLSFTDIYLATNNIGEHINIKIITHKTNPKKFLLKIKLIRFYRVYIF